MNGKQINGEAMLKRLWRALLLIAAIQWVNDMPQPDFYNASTTTARVFGYLIGIGMIVVATGRD